MRWYRPKVDGIASVSRLGAFSPHFERLVRNGSEPEAGRLPGDHLERWVGSGLVVAERQFRRIVGYRALPGLTAVLTGDSKTAGGTSSAALRSARKDVIGRPGLALEHCRPTRHCLPAGTPHTGTAEVDPVEVLRYSKTRRLHYRTLGSWRK